MNKVLGITLFILMSSGMAWGHESEEAHGVHFISPTDGSVVAGDVKIAMVVNGMTVQKAGELKAETGHFHVIIDGGFVEKGEVVAKNATHKHFGKGQTETTLKLSEGEHTLTLQFADGHHVSYGKLWSQTIHIRVK